MAPPRTARRNHAKQPKKYPSRLSGEQIFALESSDRRTRRIVIQGAVRTVQLLIAGAIVRWGAVPLASEFAGESTVVNAKLSLFFGVSLVGVAAALTAWGVLQRRSATRSDKRGRALALAIHDLRRRLREAKQNDDISPAASEALLEASNGK